MANPNNTQKLPKAPRLPVKSLILMIIFLVGGSFVISLKGLPMTSFGLDIAGIIIGYVSYLYLIGAAVFYAFFEKLD